MVKTQLVALGKYWGTLAKIIHTVRNNIKKLRGYLADRNEEGKLKRSPQKPLRGRWGSVTICELDVMNLGQDRLVFLLAKLLGEKPGYKDAPHLEPEVDEAESHGQQGHRYLREALVAVQSDNFWCTLEIAHTSRKPADHIRFWLQKVIGAKTPDIGRKCSCCHRFP
eukprot:2454894-Pyramimonas_sp.AAC.1